MKSSKMNKMKKRLLALLLCMVMMMNGSVPALASEVAASDEVNAISQDAGLQTASLEAAHEHTGECYSRSKVSDELICGKEVVEGHTHGDACYEVTNTPECICTLEETAGHSHGDGCYETVTNQNCSLSEHSHGDGCYTTEITCSTEEHSHGDECFTTETINVCGQEEVEAHTHGDGCYTTVENKTLTCELEEAEGHAHSDECYEWTEELTCTIPTETPTVEPEITTCEVCGKETCECEAEIEICEVCGKETCECEAEEEAEPITLTTEVDGTTITLAGPAEAFQEGMSYSIEATVVEAKKEIKVIEEVLEEVAVEQEKLVESYQAFDIKIIETDEEGNVTNDNFQPLNETPVMVTFSSKEVTESVENEETVTSVLHVDTEKKEAEDMAAEVTENKDVAIETTHFSVYVYVEFSVIGEIKLFVEHWIEDSEEKLYNDSEIVLENGFRGSVGDLGEICFGDQVDLGWVVSKVYRDVEGKWKELTEDIVLTEDTKLKVEYVPNYLRDPSVSLFDLGRNGSKSNNAIQYNKTATQLDPNYVSNVNLSVGGIATGEVVEIVFILGGGMQGNTETVNSAINVFKPLMEDPESSLHTIKMGIISLEKGQEIILDLNSPEARLDKDNYDDVIKEKFAYMNTLPGGTTNLHSQLLEAQKMLAVDKSVKPENKYVFLIATGRTYWFDDANGNQAMIVGKTGKLSNGDGGTENFYYYGNYTWQSLRGKHSSLYMLPDKYNNSYEDFLKDIEKWIKKDGDKYVYSPLLDKNDPNAYVNWYNNNKADWRNLYNGGKGTRYGAVIINPKPAIENFVSGVVDGIPYGDNEHAMNYERAQYESIRVYKELVDAGYNCFSICSENPNYQNNSEYITQGAKYTGTSRAQVGHSFMNYLATCGTQTEAPTVWDYERDADGNILSTNTVLKEDFFESIAAEITKSLSAGSIVEDYIGYSDGTDGDEAHNFNYIEDSLTVTVGSTTYGYDEKVTTEDHVISYSFKNGAHVVKYYPGDLMKTEKIIWYINEPVVGSTPASIDYRVELVEKVEAVGSHIAYTNQEAILHPVDSKGEEGEDLYFPRPEVGYRIWEIDILKESNGDKKLLPGAEFTLSLNETDAVILETIDQCITDENGAGKLKVIAGFDPYEEAKGNTKTITGVLRETKAPTGYQLLGDTYDVTMSPTDIEVGGLTDLNELAYTLKVEIENLPLYELPSTGGFGSSLYTLSGAVLMLSSSLIAYKKKREEDLESEE